MAGEVSPLLEFPGEVSPPRNVIARRWASPDIVRVFGEEPTEFAKRGLWIEIARKQGELGLPIPAEAIEDYVRVQAEIDLDSIASREAVSRHDVNAGIEEFNALAGHQLIMRGMTSRDLTENVEQSQILRGLDIILDRAAATLSRFSNKAIEYAALVMAGRTHNVAAQVTTLGKRFANYGEELLGGYDRLRTLREAYALRGIKGPVGTQQDMLDLFEGDEEKVLALEEHIARVLGFNSILGSVGQVYPRSMDFDVVSALTQAVSGPMNFANSVRLMAGTESATEGFKPGQVGSNAMPHKRNAAKSERVLGLGRALPGYVTMAAIVAGSQWNEGDVSCSATRRIYIPDSFYVADSVFETTMSILDGFGAYPAVIQKELERYLPFLTSTKVLMAAVKGGVGREDAHEIIKDHAVAEAIQMAEEGTTDNHLPQRLADDERLPVDLESILGFMANPIELTGSSARQIVEFSAKVDQVLVNHPGARTYKPKSKV
jgi:adenylosuccinate lyase